MFVTRMDRKFKINIIICTSEPNCHGGYQINIFNFHVHFLDNIF